MFARFVLALREAGVPASLTEYLALLGAMQAGVVEYDVEGFYFLARCALVKDERHLDRFDRVFGQAFKGVESPPGTPPQEIPEDWLRKLAESMLTPEQMRQVRALGGFDKIMAALRERLANQDKRHQGGSKNIGTNGTSPFGAHGYNPEGVRIGQDGSRHRRAVKVWDERAFADLDDTRELGTRNFRVALRRLRRFARAGTPDELDIDGTVAATAGNAGTLDLRLRAERRNTVKVLLLLDIGGSMDDHVLASEELFSAARSEFRQLEHYYFHNCLYERVWRSAARRQQASTPTEELLRRYGPDWRVVFVGDATMSPYELVTAGGSVEHWNEEPGLVWLERMTRHFRAVAWLNPSPQQYWPGTQSVRMVQEAMQDRMFPMTIEGIGRMTTALVR